MKHLVTCKRSSQGFTLIEVLVTMVILAVGLLGIAAMQLKGLQILLYLCFLNQNSDTEIHQYWRRY